MDWWSGEPAANDLNYNIGKPENCYPSYDDNAQTPDRLHKKKLSIKQLEVISKKSPEDILLELSGKRAAFCASLESQLTPDYIVVIVKIFAALSASRFAEQKLNLYTLFVNQVFIHELETFLNKSFVNYHEQSKLNKLYKDKIGLFWRNLMVCLNSVIELLPHNSQEVVPALIDGIENNYSISNISEAEIKALHIKLESVKDLPTREDRLHHTSNILDINIYPMNHELTSDYVPFVRENIIKGKYNDVNHYIDVQFRLMREDFISPIRMGICDIDYNRLQNDKSFNAYIDIYKDVRFLHKSASRNSLGFLMHVPKKRRNEKWIYGCLVGFTDGGLDQLFFGKIIEVVVQYNNFVEIVVLFEEAVDINFGINYTMILSKAYFEPYYHVLKTLQAVMLTEFPLKKYLVDVDFKREFPDYLRPSTVYNIGGQYITICKEVWPDVNIKLDSSQFAAFKYALTNKFSVIQGPPGTGKTYIGLKIVQTLIENRKNWQCSGPILVVSYTNQALDQFLEGILDTTDQIIRVGDQSKSEKLEEYKLKNLKRKYNVDNKKRRQIERVNELRDQLNMLYSMQYRISKGMCIVHFRCFEKFNAKFNSSWFRNVQEDDDIIDWLMGDIESLYTNVTWDDRTVEDVLKQFEPNNQVYSQQDSEDELENLDDLDHGNKNLFNEHNPNEVSLQDICNKIRKLTDMIRNKYQDNRELQKSLKNHKCLLLLLNSLPSMKADPEMRYIDLQNAFTMSGKQRWQLYNYWVKNYEQSLPEQISLLEADFETWAKEFEDFSEIIDTSVMREKLVIGMTTTGAAMRQKTLEILQCPIVIVEEAAEVLESHIIAALSSNCQHFIMLGDHKQLKPSTADYKMEKDFKLGVSLFERMIKNNVPFQCMNIQYRMRPEIASLICPTIYPDLQNSINVENYQGVLGVSKPVFFISHVELENNTSGSSKENAYEASFLVGLAKYLVASGNQAKGITILSAYLKQMKRIEAEKRKHPAIKDTKITCLDNFQGEENEIILLSLVRNNQDGVIGFLSQENRICVALSRAKRGLYVMGNMKLLSEKSPVWRKIQTTLQDMDAIGPKLELTCCKHGNSKKKVGTVRELQDRIRGCGLKCQEQLSCGHVCDKLCHYSPHDKQCNKKCMKVLCMYGHVCRKKCHEECGDCLVPHSVVLGCGHKTDIPCCLDEDTVKCPVKVEVMLPCQHLARTQCFKDKTKLKCIHRCRITKRMWNNQLRNEEFEEEEEIACFECTII